MFALEIIEFVWNKARKVEGFDPALIRKDSCGAWILRNEYGNTESIYGWEIDHIYPLSRGGDDNPQNLRALQWSNNRSKGDDYPAYNSAFQAEGTLNIPSEVQYTVNEGLQEQLKQLYQIDLSL